MIHPRRLKGTAGNVARYYTVGDYYTKGADEHSEWGGAIARDLKLEGQVDSAAFADLLQGKIAGQQLGRRRANEETEHHPGWDFAVNAPKSVSIMGLVAGDSHIIEAHERAVGTALSWLEEHAATRQRIHGDIVERTTGRLLFARFTEHASRELDPHLHTHVVVLNMTNDRAGERYFSLETRAMYAEQMVAGQIYRNELAHLLRERGYDVEVDPRKGLFEIRGVPHDLIKTMSRRAEQIEAYAKEHGLQGQAARRVAFYATRDAKETVSLVSLQEQWQSRLGHHEWAIEQTKAKAAEIGERPLDILPQVAARSMLFGIRQSEGKEAVNNLGTLLQRALASHVGEVRLSDIRPLLLAHEARRKLLATKHQSGDATLTQGRTTRRTARLELAFSDHLALAVEDAKPLASLERLTEQLRSDGLNTEQGDALMHLGLSPDRVTGVHGVAGAGKSTLIAALRRASHPEARFIALAPTSSAASELGKRAEISSKTVASLITGGGSGIDERNVMIVDEAGQLGNRQAIRLLEISRLTGARLIFLGDNLQTGAIEQGKPFWLLQRLGLPTAELSQSVRQQNRVMRTAVTQARLGNYQDSLAHLDKVASGEPRDKLAVQLVGEWTRLSPDSRNSTNILVLDNATRLIVNARVREVLKGEGIIAAEGRRLSILSPSGMSNQEKHFAKFYGPGQVVTFARANRDLGLEHDIPYKVVGLSRDSRGRQMVGLVDEKGRLIPWNPRLGRPSHVNIFNEEERELSIGDRIQWRLVSHALGVKNADRGTVEKLDGHLATIRWDRDDRVQQIDLSQHRTWDHGYAETVYAAQSKTYDRVYILAPVNSPLVNGRNYYTAITRARYGVKLWTEDPKRLVEKLSRNSGEKSSALEGLGRVDENRLSHRSILHGERFAALRNQQQVDRHSLRVRREAVGSNARSRGLADLLAIRAHGVARHLNEWLSSLTARPKAAAIRASDHSEAPSKDDLPSPQAEQERGRGIDR